MKVGTSGSCGARCALATPRERSWPLRTKFTTEGTVVKVSCTWPATVSATAGPTPLYGNMRDVDLGKVAESSAPMCAPLPVPAEP